MVKTGKNGKMEPAKTLSFNYTKYKDVMECMNKLAEATNRTPHNAAKQASIAIRDHMEDFMKFCRDRKVAI